MRQNNSKVVRQGAKSKSKLKTKFEVFISFKLAFIQWEGSGMMHLVQTVSVITQYNSMIHSERWTEPRPHTDFARRSKRINPLKITLPTQFLCRIEEEMFKLHISSLTTRFRTQRLRYDTFISRLLRSQCSKIAW